MTNGPFQGVIFDLDGTLYYLRKTRMRLTIALWRSIMVLRHMSSARAAIRRKAYPDEESLKEAFAVELGQRAQIPTAEAARWYDEVFFSAFIKLLADQATPRPGLLSLLSELRSDGLRLAVVSDIGCVEERLRVLGIPPELFDVVKCAEACGELKPSPRSLLMVAQKWHLDPKTIVVVGDRVDRDALAAKAAGMQSIMIDNHAPLFGTRTIRVRQLGGVPLLCWKKASATIAAGSEVRSG